MGAIVGCREWRVLIVIDREAHRRPEDAAERDVIRHIKRHRDRFRVVVVEPRHEAWLCIGLGLDSARCRSDHEIMIEKVVGKPYKKRMLSSLAGSLFDPSRLDGEWDFHRYVEGLLWLSKC